MKFILNRPLLALTTGFISGILFRFYFELPVIVLPVVLISCIFLLFFQRASVVLIFIIGTGFGVARMEIAKDNLSCRNWDQNAVVSGVVLEISEEGWFIIDCRDIQTDVKAETIRGRLKVYFKELSKEIREGDLVTISGRIRSADPDSNPGQFNYREFLKKQGIGALFYLQEILFVQRGFSIKFILNKIRKFLQGIFYTYLERDTSAFYSAIILGFREDISPQLYEAFRESGTAHFIAISGFHFFLVYLMLFCILIFIKLSAMWRQIIIIIFLTIYMLLTGMASSVVRSYVMLCTYLLSIILFRKGDGLSSISFAALIILLFEPYQLFNIGFQLSFLAVLGMMLISPVLYNFVIHIREHSQKQRFAILPFLKDMLLGSIVMSAAIWVAILPVILHNFHLSTPIMPACNLIITPFIAVSIVMGFILLITGSVLPPVASVLAYLCEFCFQAVAYFSKTLSSIPYSHLYLPSASLLCIIVYYLLLVIWRIFTRPAKSVGWSSIIFLIILTVLFHFLGFINTFRYRQPVLFVLDVKDGNFVFARMDDGRNIIFDCGSATFKDPAQSAGLGFLFSRGVTTIDTIFLSVPKPAFVSGVKTIADKIKIKKVVVTKYFIDFAPGQELIKWLEAKSCQIVIVERQEQLRDVEKCIKIFAPEVPDPELADAGFVAIVTICGEEFLLCQGASQEIIRQTIIKLEKALKADVVILPFRGKMFAGYRQFCNYTKPEAVIISASQIYSEKLVQEFIDLGARVYITGKNGAIQAEFEQGSIKIIPYLQ